MSRHNVTAQHLSEDINKYFGHLEHTMAYQLDALCRLNVCMEPWCKASTSCYST